MKDGRSATAIRLNPDVHEWLREEARKRDVSINWLVNRAVDARSTAPAGRRAVKALTLQDHHAWKHAHPATARDRGLRR